MDTPIQKIRHLKSRIYGNTVTQEFCQKRIDILEREKVRLRAKIAALMAKELSALGMKRSASPPAKP